MEQAPGPCLSWRVPALLVKRREAIVAVGVILMGPSRTILVYRVGRARGRRSEGHWRRAAILGGRRSMSVRVGGRCVHRHQAQLLLEFHLLRGLGSELAAEPVDCGPSLLVLPCVLIPDLPELRFEASNFLALLAVR